MPVAWLRDRQAWRLIGLRYLPWLAGLNLVWEVAQLPLYTIWDEASPAYLAFAVAHCTVGDILIGAAALLLALILAREGSLASWRWRRVVPLLLLLGAGYRRWLHGPERGAEHHALPLELFGTHADAEAGRAQDRLVAAAAMARATAGRVIPGATPMLTTILENVVGGAAETRDLDANEFLFRQGDTATHVFAVETGRIKLARYLSNGKVVVMHIAQPGHTFTEAALFSDVYHCNGVAEIRSRVRAFRKSEILAAVGASPKLALDYIRSLSKEVQRLRLQLELHSIPSARERILQFLVLEADPGSLAVEIQGSLKDLAASLGLAHETLYREVARLEDEGLIAREKTSIRLLKLPPL